MDIKLIDKLYNEFHREFNWENNLNNDAWLSPGETEEGLSKVTVCNDLFQHLLSPAGDPSTTSKHHVVSNQMKNHELYSTGRSPVPLSHRVALTVESRSLILSGIQKKMYPVVFGDHPHILDRISQFLKIEWSKTLNSTAGTTKMKRIGGQRSASIQLSVKVLDTTAKLWTTFAHELCHAAMWLIDGESKPPHGPKFKSYGRMLENAFHSLEVATTHDYEINYKFRWQCRVCSHVYGRHSRSIDPKKQRCGRCKGGTLVQIKPAPRAPRVKL